MQNGLFGEEPVEQKPQPKQTVRSNNNDDFDVNSQDAVLKAGLPSVKGFEVGALQEIIGEHHNIILKRFLSAFHRQKLHHATVFYGDKGVGKCALAFLIAKHILSCDGSESLDVSDGSLLKIDEAVQKQMERGACQDLLYMSPDIEGGNISVDEVRKLKSFVNLGSSGAKFKVVIIDSVDNLNASGANSLLKVLEEPPSDTFFFLISHNYQSLLPTIKSRSQSVFLKNLSDNEIKLYIQSCDGGSFGSIDPDFLIAFAAGSIGRLLTVAKAGVKEMHDKVVQVATMEKKNRILLFQSIVDEILSKVAEKNGADELATKNLKHARIDMFFEVLVFTLSQISKALIDSLTGDLAVDKGASASKSSVDLSAIDSKKFLFKVYETMLEINKIKKNLELFHLPESRCMMEAAKLFLILIG